MGFLHKTKTIQLSKGPSNDERKEKQAATLGLLVTKGTGLDRDFTSAQVPFSNTVIKSSP